MPVYQHKAGLQNVGSYQVGGKPFFTGSALDAASPNNGEVKITFPNVTKNVLIVNTTESVPILVHFNSRTQGNVISGHHYFTLEEKKDSVSLNSKCREIFISLETTGSNGSFEMVADLTGIDAQEMFELTGSGLTD